MGGNDALISVRVLLGHTTLTRGELLMSQKYCFVTTDVYARQLMTVTRCLHMTSITAGARLALHARCLDQACRGYGYPWIYLWIYPCVDIRLGSCYGYIHGYLISVFNC